MKFAFSTLSCPGWDIASVAAHAKEFGYDGVELFGALREANITSSNAFLHDPAKVRGTFEEHNIQLVCLAGSVAMTGIARADRALAADVIHFIDIAHRLGCGLVKVLDTALPPGRSRTGAAVALGDWLMPLGDYAADRHVAIVVENALTFRTASEMWTVLDRLHHPSIGCCWDIFHTAVAGESPTVSVPVLNQKIQHVHAKDAKFGPNGAVGCKLGEGELPVEKAFSRLRGIGYGGYVSLEWEPQWIAQTSVPEVVLRESLDAMRKWAGVEVRKSEPTSGSGPLRGIE